MGAYLRWALIRSWALIKFSPFSASEVCLFCKKTITANNKTPRSNKARFLKNTLKKTRVSLLSEFIHSSGLGGGERLLEFDWEKEGVGAYSRLDAY